jgi:hypothetical protein
MPSEQQCEFQPGDFVEVVDPECRALRLRDGYPVSGHVVRVTPLPSGGWYVESRGCARNWGCNAVALGHVDASKFRWRRKS